MSKKDDIRERGRFDIIQRVVAFDEETGHFEMKVEPDPLRYEWQEHEGERLLYDRLDRTVFPHKLVMEMLREALSMRRPPPLAVLANIARYAADRRRFIAATLDGREAAAELADASETLLATLAGDALGFVVMSVDIVESSMLANSLDTTTLSRMLSSFVTELSHLVAMFHGHVLRYTGDGLIAYFPEPSFITKNDLAVDCALCVRRFVYEAFDPVLEERGLRRLDIRIGLDAGEAAVSVLGSPMTKRHLDLIGDVVSLACNIEAAGGPGEVLLGDTVERNLHVTWRQQCEPFETPEDWNLKGPDDKLYRLHRLQLDAARPIEGPPRRAAD